MRVFYGELAIVIDDAYYKVEVLSDIDEKKLTKGKAYLIGDNDFVLPYFGKISKESQAYEIGIYKYNNGYICNPPETDKDWKKYSEDNIVEYNTDSIFNHIEKNRDNFINSEDVEVINNNSEVYLPVINEDDDFLKVIIKQAIIAKKINLNNYQKSFDNTHSLSNMKSALRKDTKMTVGNFLKWCEILGLDWEVTLSDAGVDKISPLREEIRLSSND